MKLTTAFLSLVSAAALVSAGKFHPSEVRPNVEVVEGAFIVEFHDGVDRVKANNFLNSRKVNFKVRGEYSLFNGAAINVQSGHKGEDLAKIPGVKRVWPVELYQLPKLIPSNEDPTKPLLTSAHRMTGVDYIQKTFKYTGKGIKVAVIDSGVDYTHPALGGCFGKGCRVRYGWDFVGDAYDGTNAKPDSDPKDECSGHGTHVAGIIGADARKVAGAPQPFVGVAPDVTLGAYRRSGSNDVIMLAMELAFNQGFDIINMSLGSGSAYRSTPIAVLADKLSAHGLTVVASAGNDGADGVWSVSNAGLGEFSTSVASFDNIEGKYFYVTYGGVEHPYSFSSAWNQMIDLPAEAILLPVIENGVLSDGCTAASYAGQNVTGKVVLVLGDTTRCKSGGRGAAAKAAGAAGMLVQSLPTGINSLGGIPGFPMGALENTAADAMFAEAKKNPAAVITWSKTSKVFQVEGGGNPSPFSSWGLDGDLHIKPEVSGPGGNILSTYPGKMGSYSVLSGTSMSSPYVAGAYALLFNHHKKTLHGAEARRIFMNTAVPGSFYKQEALAPVAKQGAGLINIKRAITTETAISPDRIELLDSKHFAGKSVEVKIKNNSKRSVVYTLGHEATQSAISYRGGNSFPLLTPILENDHASVKFSQAKITVRAGKTAKVNIQFSEPTTGKPSEFPFYSGYIVATPNTKGGVSVRVPYAGVLGDVSQVPIQDTDFGVPLLTVINKATGKQTVVPKGYPINWATERAAIFSRIGSHTPDLSIRLLESATGRDVGYLNTQIGAVFGPKGRARNISSSTGRPTISQYNWADGLVYTATNATTPTPVPAGEYKVVVASQRKLSQGSFPGDYEIFEVADLTL